MPEFVVGSGRWSLTDEYIRRVEKRQRRKKTLSFYVFGLGFGHILLLWSLFGWLNTPSSWLDIVFVAGMVSAGIIIICTFLLPELQRVVSLLFQKMGTLLFWLLLSVVYILCFVPANIWKKRKNAQVVPEPKTSFVNHTKTITRSSNNKAIHILNIVNFFISERMYYILPAIVILILLGLFLAFLQTSVVAPLIYTFF